MLDQPKNQIIRNPNPEPAARTFRCLESIYTGQANKKKKVKVAQKTRNSQIIRHRP